jgi:hypothetical protein
MELNADIATLNAKNANLKYLSKGIWRHHSGTE